MCWQTESARGDVFLRNILIKKEMNFLRSVLFFIFIYLNLSVISTAR